MIAWMPYPKFVSTFFFDKLMFIVFLVQCYGGSGRIIVFSSTKADANALLLSDKITHDVEVMHGDIA